MTDPYPASNGDKAPTPGSRPPEKIEKRGNVGTATPEAYPKADREDGDVTGADNPAPRANKQGCAPVSGSGVGAGGGRQRQ